MFRPVADADDIRPPSPVFLTRLIKLIPHELGHTFGLGTVGKKLSHGIFRQPG